jgi:hypothetical protein
LGVYPIKKTLLPEIPELITVRYIGRYLRVINGPVNFGAPFALDQPANLLQLHGIQEIR